MAMQRRVSLVGAVGIGVGSMLGAGVFLIWPTMVGLGWWALVAITFAGVIAAANALSTAQLASRYPVAGGAYAYGAAELGHTWGVLAGWSFVVGKTASVVVGAGVVGAYLAPDQAQWIAAGAVAVAWALNAGGITRTAGTATAIAITVALGLLVVVALLWLRPSPTALAETPMVVDRVSGLEIFVFAVAATFFAFAGYARIATLGEEVIRPARTIPRAIMGALAVVLALYLVIAATIAARVEDHVFMNTDVDGNLTTRSPKIDPVVGIANAADIPTWPVQALAVLAAFGATVALMAGAGRTLWAMARGGDAPQGLLRLGQRDAPWRAELVVAVAAVIAIITLWTNTTFLWVSVVTVLVYYAVANAAAIAQRRASRTAAVAVPMAVSVFGLVGCAGLAIIVAWQAWQHVVPALSLYAVLAGALLFLVVWRTPRGLTPTE